MISGECFFDAGTCVDGTDLVARSGGWEASSTGGPNFEVPVGMRTGEFINLVNRDPTVRRIEDRIALATGISVSHNSLAHAFLFLEMWHCRLATSLLSVVLLPSPIKTRVASHTLLEWSHTEGHAA
jgi:hypothetical protein